jgi:hypothetical protein
MDNNTWINVGMKQGCGNPATSEEIADQQGCEIKQRASKNYHLQFRLLRQKTGRTTEQSLHSKRYRNKYAKWKQACTQRGER